MLPTYDLGRGDELLKIMTLPVEPQIVTESFEEHLDANPEKHFLSPIQPYEYETWSDDDDDEYDDSDLWDAGITDYSAYVRDRRAAQETDQPLPPKWDNLVSEQEEALQRSVARAHLESSPAESVPELTPDRSPDLPAAVLDWDEPLANHINAANYLSLRHATSARPDTTRPPLPITLSPEIHATPLRIQLARSLLSRPKPHLPVPRPGMRHAHCLSGKRHVWKRPPDGLWTVREDARAEARAEKGGEMAVKGFWREYVRGRGRVR